MEKNDKEIPLMDKCLLPFGVQSEHTTAGTANDPGCPQELESAIAENGIPADLAQELRCGLSLEWRDITCFVSEPEEQGRFAKCLGLEPRAGPPTKQIMTGSSGFARPGEILAVMGPSGSGKTTLLNVLAKRPTLGSKGRWTGELFLNGTTPWENWEREMAYVMQKDIFYDELTVSENLTTTAKLRLPFTWAEARKQAFLKQMLQYLSLEEVQNTRVGTAVERGLSGGEIKRTSIANESLALPRIFLLDEPLTGLDSSRAVDVMTKLKLMAQEGTTVMLTIHQPSSELYSCFDRLLLLGPGGRTAYFGAVADAVNYFSEIGRPIPQLWAPSDHYIKLLVDKETCTSICDAWATRPSPEAPGSRPRPPCVTPMPPLGYQMRALFPRAFLRIKRSYLKRLNIKLHVALALVWGLIYWRVGDDMPARLDDFVGAVFFIVAHWSWTPLFQGLGNFPREKEMLTKEKASRVYDIKAFFFTHMGAEAPILPVLPLIFFAIIWPMACFPFSVLVQTFLVIMLNIQVCASMSMFISTWCMDEEVAIPVAIVFMIYQMCSGGYFADMRKLPWFIGWIRFTSFYYYTFGSVLRLLVAEPYGEENHKKALQKFSFSEAGYMTETAALFGMMVVFRVAAYFQLRFSKKLQFS